MDVNYEIQNKLSAYLIIQVILKIKYCIVHHNSLMLRINIYTLNKMVHV